MKLTTAPIAALMSIVLGLAAAAARAEPARPPADLRWQPHDVMDNTYRGVRIGSLALPAGWTVENKSVWAYDKIYHPFRAHLRAAAADGSVFSDTFPVYTFMWPSGAVANTTPMGPGPLGPIVTRPGITAAQAVHQAIVQRFRGQKPGLKVVGWKPVPTLPLALKHGMQGDSIVMRLEYQEGGETVEEDIYAFFEKVYTASFTGPMGTSYEHHRWLRFAHSFGARGGRLAAWMPVLGYIGQSVQPDPRWAELNNNVYQQVNQAFQARMQRGWDSIRAAGETSRMISANNDAMIAALRTRQAASDSSRERTSRGFSEYIRGVERVQDGGGTVHTVDSGSSYYWKSAQGTILGTNDVGNPNVGSMTSWQQLTPVR
jgi:hypothetical protein